MKPFYSSVSGVDLRFETAAGWVYTRVSETVMATVAPRFLPPIAKSVDFRCGRVNGVITCSRTGDQPVVWWEMICYRNYARHGDDGIWCVCPSVTMSQQEQQQQQHRLAGR